MNENTHTLSKVAKVHSHMLFVRAFYYILFLTVIFAQHVLNIHIPDAVYYLDVFALLGGDVQQLASRFFRLK